MVQTQTVATKQPPSIQRMRESEKHPDPDLNEESFISLLVSFLDSLICLLLGHAFSSLSILLHIVEFCWRPLKTIKWTESWSASEYVLDVLGEYEGDGYDLIEAPPFRLSWPVTTNVSLHRVREAMETEDAHASESFDESQVQQARRPSMKRRRSPRSLRFKNELAEKSSSFAKRIRPERTNLAETINTIADENTTDQVSNQSNNSSVVRRRSLKLKNELAEKTNSIAELIKTEKTKLAEKGNFLAERIHLQERSTNIAERIQTERTKLNERKTAITQRIKLVKSNTVTDRIKLTNRSSSLKERVKVEVMG